MKLAAILDRLEPHYGKQERPGPAGYRAAQEAVEAELQAQIPVLQRAYLLIQRHGRQLCKRTRPLCDACPVSSDCAYHAAHVCTGHRT